MTSWRDTASTAAQRDLDGLLRNVMPLAERTLGKHGELLPYAATIDNDGNEALVSTDPGHEPELPNSHDVLALLYKAAGNSAASLRAVAFVAAVRVSDADAIRVELEHREGIAMTVVIPYERNEATESITIGTSRAIGNATRVWAPIG